MNKKIACKHMFTGYYGSLSHYQMVPETGLEPARISPPPPQGGVSTNFTTPACRVGILELSFKLSRRPYINSAH